MPAGGIAIAVLAVLTAISVDPLVRSTWALSTATAGLVLATFALVAVTYWQANQWLHFEDKRERERVRRERARQRREEIDRTLADHFGPTWREDIQQVLKSEDAKTAQKVLDPFGVGLSELKLFPNLQREATKALAQLQKEKERERLERLREHDPNAYEEEMERRREEEMRNEKALDEYIARQARERAERESVEGGGRD